MAGSWRLVIRRLSSHRLAMIGMVILVLVVAITVVGGRLWRYGYAEITDDLSSPPSWRHPMGTDGLGRDLFAQVLRGTQKSLQVGLLVAVASTAVGTAIGCLAGYFRGVLDALLMRFTDMVIAVPGIAVLAVLAGSVQSRSGNWFAIALILSALSWTGLARVVRSVVLTLRELEFIEAARAMGAGSGRILVRHLLPHLTGPVTVKASLTVGSAILAEAALSYLGLGITSPDTSLGRLIETGQQSATTRPWLFYFPGAVVMSIVLSVNFVGEGLRDALDPSRDSLGRR